MEVIPIKVAPGKFWHLFYMIPGWSLAFCIISALALRSDLAAGSIPFEIYMFTGVGGLVGIMFIITVMFTEKDIYFDPVRQNLYYTFPYLKFLKTRHSNLGKPVEIVIYEKRNRGDTGPSYFHFLKVRCESKAKYHSFECDSVEDARDLARKISDHTGARVIDQIKNEDE